MRKKRISLIGKQSVLKVKAKAKIFDLIGLGLVLGILKEKLTFRRE